MYSNFNKGNTNLRVPVRDLNQEFSRERSNQLDTRGSARDLVRGSPRDLDRGYKRESSNEFDYNTRKSTEEIYPNSRGSSRNLDRGYPKDPTRGTPRDFERELKREDFNEFDLSMKRSSKKLDRGSSRERSFDPSAKFTRDLTKESPRNMERGFNRERSTELDYNMNGSSREFDQGLNRERPNEFESNIRGSARDLDRYSKDINNRSSLNLYTLHVTTSNKKMAGTDATVYIELIGAKTASGKMPLTVSQTPGNMFEAGKVDVFKIKCEDVGELRKLRIGHDNKGISAAWHLKEVLVESQLDGMRWLFKCNRWLDKKQEDGKIERELLPVDSSPRSRSRSVENRFDSYQSNLSDKGPNELLDNRDSNYPSLLDSPTNNIGVGRRNWDKNRFEDPFKTTSSDQITYKIYVTTSGLRGAGTDANVYVNIYGYKLNTGQIFLKSSRAHMNMFEAGNTDYFEVLGHDVGEIEMLKIGHDNKGLSSAWHLKEVVVETRDKGKFLFPCDQWLDRKHGDGKIERDLFPEKRQMTVYPEREGRPFTYAPGDRDPYGIESPIEYKISVTTSDLKFAGTDANVYVNIFGRKSDTGRIFLKPSKSNVNCFEQGVTDHFTITGADVGEIKMLRIGHDNKGLSSGWHLKEVVIETPDSRKYIFRCDQWLDKKEGYGKIERDLFGAEEKREMTESDFRQFIGHLIDYSVTVRTSDILNAGTDANVYIKIYGNVRKSDPIGLEKSLSHRNKFETGQTDRFELKEEFFGDIFKIKIGHDNKGLAPGWHLNEIVINCVEMNKKWSFACNRWLATDEDDGRIELELYPKTKELEEDMTQYVVEVFTGDEKKAGTDSNVYLTIIGAKGESSEKALEKSETHHNKFERNHMDRFVIYDRNFGELCGIRIRHDNAGISPGWFLDRVEITDKFKNKKYVFMCQRWLSLHQDDGKIERILKEQNYKVHRIKPQTKDKKDGRKEKLKKIVTCYKEYYIKFYTGIKQAISGTDMNVYIRLFGDNGESKITKLDFKENKAHDRNFERNQIDLFVVRTEYELGTLYALELKFENCLKTANDLHIEKVQVSYDDYLYEFQYDKQVTVRDYHRRYKQLILLENNAQFL